MTAPVFFIRSGLWWAQTNDKYGLVSGSGMTQEEARKAWEKEYARVLRDYEQ